jgi:hypothetical protein
MKLRALVSFSGEISVSKGREFEATKAVADDLIAAGYAELVAKNGTGSDKGKGGNAPTPPPQTPPQVEDKTEEEDKAPATSTAKDNKSGAEKDK